MTDFDKYLIDLVKNWKGPIIDVTAAGCGASFGRLLAVPGSSKLIGSINLPYAREAVRACMEDGQIYDIKSVSPEVSQALCKWKTPPGISVPVSAHASIGITAALTSNRHRRGENQAYITIALTSSNGYSVWSNRGTYHLTFSKLSEEVFSDPIRPWAEQVIMAKRQSEDEEIARFVLDKIKVAT